MRRALNILLEIRDTATTKPTDLSFLRLETQTTLFFNKVICSEPCL